MASTQLELLKVLCHNRETQCRHLQGIRKQAQQPENTFKTAAVHHLQDHDTAVYPIQNHKSSVLPSHDLSISVPPFQDHITGLSS